MRSQVRLPDGNEHDLQVALQAKSGRSGSYDIRCETTLSGAHEVHVMLYGTRTTPRPLDDVSLSRLRQLTAVPPALDALRRRR